MATKDENQQGVPFLPPGFRFHPTDEELVNYYLTKKVMDSSFAVHAISEVDLNKCEPWDIPGEPPSFTSFLFFLRTCQNTAMT